MTPTTEISLIVAMDELNLIGRDNGLPWRLPEDLKRFRRLTLGKTVLMGRKTFESLGKPLDGRENWVVSRNSGFRPAGCHVFSGVAEALAQAPPGELMVIGGTSVFREALPRARRIYLTRVHAQLEGDTWFPHFEPEAFREVAREDHPADERHAWSYSFITLERA
jgi:dihydrofolate reductase